MIPFLNIQRAAGTGMPPFLPLYPWCYSRKPSIPNNKFYPEVSERVFCRWLRGLRGPKESFLMGFQASPPAEPNSDPHSGPSSPRIGVLALNVPGTPLQFEKAHKLLTRMILNA